VALAHTARHRNEIRKESKRANMAEANPMLAQIDLEQVEAIKTLVEKSLPRAVIAGLEQAGVSLTLGLSSDADFQPVSVDYGLHLSERAY
jgi:hypothetical protein